MHNGEALGCARQCDVERTKPHRLVVDDVCGLDHHNPVEFETLHQAHRNNRETGVEGAGGRTTVDDTRDSEAG